MAEMTFGEALDQIRVFHARFVKPFEKLEQVMAVATDVRARLPAAQRDLDELGRSIASQTAALAALDLTVVQAKKDADEQEAAARARQTEAARAETQAAQKLRAMEESSNERARELYTAITAEADRKKSALEHDYHDRKKEWDATIAGLVAKKNELDTAIAALKAKF